MVATRGRTFKRPWRRSCLSSKLKSSSAPIGRKDSWCFHAVGSSNAPLLGSTAAEGLPRIGRTSIATRWRSCGLPQSASCSENFVIPPDVFGQTLRPAVTVRLAWALLTRPLSMLGLHQLYDLTSLSTTQTRALRASSLMLPRVRLDSRLVPRVRAMSRSRPRMELSEFVARSVAVVLYDVIG